MLITLKGTDFLNYTAGVRHNIWGNEQFDVALHSPSAFLVLPLKIQSQLDLCTYL